MKLTTEIVDRIQFYLQENERKKKEDYTRQEYVPGEACEFDWGEDRLTIAGKSRIIQLEVFSPIWRALHQP